MYLPTLAIQKIFILQAKIFNRFNFKVKIFNPNLFNPKSERETLGLGLGLSLKLDIS